MWSWDDPTIQLHLLSQSGNSQRLMAIYLLELSISIFIGSLLSGIFLFQNLINNPFIHMSLLVSLSFAGPNSYTFSKYCTAIIIWAESSILNHQYHWNITCAAYPHQSSPPFLLADLQLLNFLYRLLPFSSNIPQKFLCLLDASFRSRQWILRLVHEMKMRWNWN